MSTWYAKCHQKLLNKLNIRNQYIYLLQTAHLTKLCTLCNDIDRSGTMETISYLASLSFTSQHDNDLWPLLIHSYPEVCVTGSGDCVTILTLPVSASLANMTMTSDPCSYTVTQKSVSVTGSGDCVTILTLPVSASLANMTMTSDPCSYTVTQKSVSVTGSGDCVAINFGQHGDKSWKVIILFVAASCTLNKTLIIIIVLFEFNSVPYFASRYCVHTLK